MVCDECGRSCEDQPICDRCLATMFDRNATTVPTLAPEPTGPREVPQTVSEAIQQAKSLIEANRKAQK